MLRTAPGFFTLVITHSAVSWQHSGNKTVPSCEIASAQSMVQEKWDVSIEYFTADEAISLSGNPAKQWTERDAEKRRLD